LNLRNQGAQTILWGKSGIATPNHFPLQKSFTALPEGLKMRFWQPRPRVDEPEALFLRRIATENQDPRRSWLRFGEPQVRKMESTLENVLSYRFLSL
jgi:hypothetical protein